MSANWKLWHTALGTNGMKLGSLPWKLRNVEKRERRVPSKILVTLQLKKQSGLKSIPSIESCVALRSIPTIWRGSVHPRLTSLNVDIPLWNAS